MNENKLNPANTPDALGVLLEMEAHLADLHAHGVAWLNVSDGHNLNQTLHALQEALYRHRFQHPPPLEARAAAGAHTQEPSPAGAPTIVAPPAAPSPAAPPAASSNMGGAVRGTQPGAPQGGMPGAPQPRPRQPGAPQPGPHGVISVVDDRAPAKPSQGGAHGVISVVDEGLSPVPPTSQTPPGVTSQPEAPPLKKHSEALARLIQKKSLEAGKTQDAQPGALQSPSREQPAPNSGNLPSPWDIATLESLQMQYRNCANCGLSESRNRLVFGAGHEAPRILFVGEGPGAEEDQQGIPFVGRAGKLLTGLILATGLTREDTYITNVVKCRPPQNRNPEPHEMASCGPILQRQIELLNPALIIALGNVPLKFFKPNARGITSERGKVFEYGNWLVLPTFHPSYLLRNQNAIADCWLDFRQAMDRVYPGW